MNERQWWSSHVRPAWHKPADGWTSLKVQDAYNGGLFDTINSWQGVVAAIELKWLDGWPKRETTAVLKDQSEGGAGLSPEQRRWLEIWQEGQGLSYVLLGVCMGQDHEWFLFSLGMVPKAGMTRQEAYKLCQLNGVRYESLVSIPTFFIQNYHGVSVKL